MTTEGDDVNIDEEQATASAEDEISSSPQRTREELLDACFQFLAGMDVRPNLTTEIVRGRDRRVQSSAPQQMARTRCVKCEEHPHDTEPVPSNVHAIAVSGATPFRFSRVSK
jgi:hypothetical protein